MPANSPKPHDFAALAKRISSWTTKSLLTAIVLVAGLGFGRQVLVWWAADPTPKGPATIALSRDGLGDPTQFHTLRFGDNSWSLQRRVIVGDKDKAAEQLRIACRDVLAADMRANEPPLPPAPLPRADKGSLDRTAHQQTDNRSESEFLSFLSTSSPVDQKPGKWRLYELRDAFPMAVGLTRPEIDGKPLEKQTTRSENNASLPSVQRTDTPEPPETGSNLAQLGYRVVIWGLAMPTAQDQWALCLFQPGLPSAEGGHGLGHVPLPPESRRTLSLSATGGGGIVAFSGPDQPAEWKWFYDDWFSRQKWQPVADWQPVGNAWYAKFALPDRGDAVDIRFGPDGRGGASGLLMLTPGGPR